MGIWDSYSASYDKVTPLTLFYNELLNKTLSFLNPKNKTLNKILDMGCGTGILISRLAGKGQKLYGIDSNKSMLSIARSKFNGLDHVSLFEQDGESLDFPDKSFDAVVSLNVLYCVNNPHKFLGEARRVLDDDGVLVLSSLKPDPDLSILFENAISHFKATGRYEEVKKDLETVIGCNKAIGKTAFKNLYNADEIRNILHEIGMLTIYSDDHTYMKQGFFIVAKKNGHKGKNN